MPKCAGLQSRRHRHECLLPASLPPLVIGAHAPTRHVSAASTMRHRVSFATRHRRHARWKERHRAEAHRIFISLFHFRYYDDAYARWQKSAEPPAPPHEAASARRAVFSAFSSMKNFSPGRICLSRRHGCHTPSCWRVGLRRPTRRRHATPHAALATIYRCCTCAAPWDTDRFSFAPQSRGRPIDAGLAFLMRATQAAATSNYGRMRAMRAF